MPDGWREAIKTNNFFLEKKPDPGGGTQVVIQREIKLD